MCIYPTMYIRVGWKPKNWEIIFHPPKSDVNTQSKRLKSGGYLPLGMNKAVVDFVRCRVQSDIKMVKGPKGQTLGSLEPHTKGPLYSFLNLHFFVISCETLQYFPIFSIERWLFSHFFLILCWFWNPPTKKVGWQRNCYFRAYWMVSWQWNKFLITSTFNLFKWISFSSDISRLY